MGNRAVITTNKDLSEVGIYLHWNGGRDSVEGFLTYCKLKGYRPPERDCYGWAYLAGVISNFFGDGHSTGVDIASHLDCDNYDNGVYLIENWNITGRMYHEGREQQEYPLREIVKGIDEAQPERMRLTPEEWSKFDEIEKQTIQPRTKAAKKK